MILQHTQVFTQRSPIASVRSEGIGLNSVDVPVLPKLAAALRASHSIKEKFVFNKDTKVYVPQSHFILPALQGGRKRHYYASQFIAKPKMEKKLAKIFLESDSIEASFAKCFRFGFWGSGATLKRANSTFRVLEKFLKDKGWGKFNPRTITLKQIKAFIKHRLETIAIRTLQNEVSHLRSALRRYGRILGNVNKKHNVYSLSSLGVPRASRISLKGPCNIDSYGFAMEHGSAGIRHVLRLEKHLGLRRKEAVAAGNLSQWYHLVMRHDPTFDLELPLNKGTKGNRPRNIHVPACEFEEVKKVIRAAYAFKRKHGHMIIAKTLKKALRRYEGEMSRLGMVKENAGHSLRRLFALNRYQHYLLVGLTEEEALAKLSEDLGHGDHRGIWVKQNYLGWMFYIKSV